NGLSQVQLNCVASSGVPAFTTLNPNQQPSDCAGGTGVPTAPTNAGEVDYFDPGTKYPQSFEAAVGVDKKLPWDLVGSVDFLYTRDVNGWYVTDENLVLQGTNGEGRAMYGTANANGSVTPSRLDSGPTARLVQAIKTFNKSGGRVF